MSRFQRVRKNETVEMPNSAPMPSAVKSLFTAADWTWILRTFLYEQ